MSLEVRNCQNCEVDFKIESDDLNFYSQINVPEPTICSDCRLQRRLAWRNMRSIYKRNCDLCKKDKISIFSPDKDYVTYCSGCWWSDSWDPLEYGQDYDPNRSFFEQFDELMHKTPLAGRFGLESTALNSDYVNMFKDIKECYLCFHIDNCERCLYSYHVDYCNDSNALSFSYSNELCYESMAIQKCNRVFYSKYSESCIDSWFLKNCSGSTDCFASANLRGKQYYIFNKPYPNKEAYEAKLKEIGFNQQSYLSVQAFFQKAKVHWEKYPSKYMHGLKNANATGEFVNNSKNTFSAFAVRDGEDIKYAMFLITGGGKNSMDWTQYGDAGELLYEVMASGGGSYNCHFGTSFWNGSKNSQYGWFNVNVSDCFGTVSLRNKKYCILNKQYSKEEYDKLRDQILEKMKTDGEYGEFPPIQISPFGYNETTAQEDFPLTQEEAKEKGYKWTDIEKNKGEYKATVEANELADDIKDVDDSILKEIINCSECNRVYRIVSSEFNFHKNLSLPIPRLCVDCRYEKLTSLRNEFKLYSRKCQCAGKKSDNEKYVNVTDTHQPHEKGIHCPNEFETSYSPENSEIVYCESCYQAEMV